MSQPTKEQCDGKKTMSQPTKEQWKEIELQLDALFSPVYLKCDEYYVGFALVRNKSKLVINVYVNGWIKGEWFGVGDKMSEEARRFWRLRTSACFTAKQLKLYEKIYGKRECKKKGMYKKRMWPDPMWNRPRPLINHLKKHNQNIEIIDYKTYKAAIEAMKDE